MLVRFTEWDGTQRIRLTPERAFEKLAEYLTYTDDVQQAFDWLMREGLDLEGTRIMGVDDFLAALREEMRQRQEQFNLDQALDTMRQRLDEVLDLERQSLDRQGEREGTRREFIDRPAERLSDAIERLRDYEFGDSRASSEFDTLREEIDNIRRIENFQQRFGEMFQGPSSLGYEEALELIREMDRLRQLEEDLLNGNLEQISLEALREMLGDDAAQDFLNLLQVMTVLTSSGLLANREGRVELSPKGTRKIGQLALRDIYQNLLRDRSGGHKSDHRGLSEVLPESTKRYLYGDPLQIDVVRTLKNALARGASYPLRLHPDDFEVMRSVHATTSSTVLLLDMSWSMSWEGRFAAAKKVALAMESLIRSRYPRDYFSVVGFYTRATELKLKDLPEASWNMGDPFTNLQDGLRLASDLLRRHPSPNQHMIVITDGQPTAYFSRGRLYCEWPLSFGGISIRAAKETLREVERVTRQGVVINTFMLDDSPSLRAFVERMTRINKGRALFSRPDRLGEYLLVDYIARKRKKV
jgi:uncharacterized protein with von Willebrand factor type A (vWA) domain